MALTEYAAKKLLDGTQGCPALWVVPITGASDPGTTNLKAATTTVTGGTVGYTSCVPIADATFNGNTATRDAAMTLDGSLNEQLVNAADIVWAAWAAGGIVHRVAWVDSVTLGSGNIWFFNDADLNVTVGAGNQPKIAAGQATTKLG